MPTSLDDFKRETLACIKVLKAAKKNRVSLRSHPYYSEKARSSLARLRRSFLRLKYDYPQETYPRVAFQILSVESMLVELIALFPSSAKEMVSLLQEMRFKTDSDLLAEIEAASLSLQSGIQAPFLPEDIFEDRQNVLKKLLWEVNRTYQIGCYNSCATILRRIIEGLIIGAYSNLKIEDRIKTNGEYLMLNRLIGKAIAESKLNLSRNTKKGLPNLKFFGDIGAHSRHVLVRKQDLDRLHNDVRVCTEELARKI